MFSVVKSFFFPPKFDVIEKSDATIENLGHIADFKKKPIPSQPHRFYADHKEGLRDCRRSLGLWTVSQICDSMRKAFETLSGKFRKGISLAQREHLRRAI